MKKLSASEGIAATLQIFADPLRLEDIRKDVLRDELPTHIVDTCCVYDTGMWETGVAPTNRSFTVVEQYEDRNAAVLGHQKWVQTLTANPHIELTDINLWDLGDDQ